MQVIITIWIQFWNVNKKTSEVEPKTNNMNLGSELKSEENCNTGCKFKRCLRINERLYVWRINDKIDFGRKDSDYVFIFKKK